MANLTTRIGVGPTHLPIGPRVAPGPGPTPEEQIIALFANGEQGILYMPWLPGTLWQDTAGTVHAGSGDPVGRISDLSGGANDAIQSTGGARPTLSVATSIHELMMDGVDDALVTTALFGLGPSMVWTHIVVGRVIGDTGSADVRQLAGLIHPANYLSVRSRSQAAIYQLNAIARSGGSTLISTSVSPGLGQRGSATLFREVFSGGSLSFRAATSGGAWTATPASGTLDGPTSQPYQVGGGTTSGYTSSQLANLLIDRVLTADEIQLVETTFAARCGITL